VLEVLQEDVARLRVQVRPWSAPGTQGCCGMLVNVCVRLDFCSLQERFLCSALLMGNALQAFVLTSRWPQD
jgi:hypothetical protein